MNVYDAVSAIEQMTKTGNDSVESSENGLKVEWSWIRASEAKDYDGTHAGWPSDDRWVLQKIVWKGSVPRYTNFWSYRRP
jgi:hypothetical protein